MAVATVTQLTVRAWRASNHLGAIRGIAIAETASVHPHSAAAAGAAR